MSDLISTPSQTPSAVSNEAFEALIDLLAFDGVDEYPSKQPANASHTQSNVTLRDPSGKLDFDKIRLMFAAQNGTHPVSTAQELLGEEKNQAQSSATPHEDGDSDDEHHSHRSTSTVPSRSNSMSPKPVTRAAASHRRSSTFGNQPWVAIHENVTTAKDNQLPTPSHQHLSFQELNAALVGAHEEVKSLRERYDELRALVSKRLGTEIRDQAKFSQTFVNNEKAAPVKQNGHAETRAAGSQAIVPSAPPLPDLPVEIANLSEDEAKRALDALVRSLNLSPSILGSLASLSTAATPTSPKQHLFPQNPARQHDVASITCALKFLGTVDELVWRRTSAPSGPRTLSPMFSEENTVALLARLELWERAVRRSTRV